MALHVFFSCALFFVAAEMTGSGDPSVLSYKPKNSRSRTGRLADWQTGRCAGRRNDEYQERYEKRKRNRP